MPALLYLWPLMACPGDPLDRVDAAIYSSEPTWSSDIAPLLDLHCVRCHDGESAFEGGVELASYASARSTRIPTTCTAASAAVIDQFAEVLTLPTDAASGEPCFGLEPLSMPPGASTRLSPTEQVLLARWVETGAPE